MIQVFGIPNCDSVRKVRSWLDAQNIGYVFHDYKKSGVPTDLLREWVSVKGWETLLNRKGATWRSLDDASKAGVRDAETAIAVMVANPSIIKRPVLTNGKQILIGPDESMTVAKT